MSPPLTPRNIVILCDGTGQDRSDPASNVVHLARRLPENAADQSVCYIPGLGNGPEGLLGRWFGYGLVADMAAGYRFLVRHYRPGDRVFLLGYSRGAYAMRALSGLLDRVGLIREPDPRRQHQALRLYTRRAPASERAAFAERYARACPVHFIGAWDTVASLGYLYGRAVIMDTTLAASVRHARHALAINERRPKFEPLLWSPDRLGTNQTLRQRWFTGAHGDVGGGYARRGLAEIALGWMLTEAQAVGLRVREDYSVAQPPDPFAPMHRPWQRWPGRLLVWLFGGERPRRIPEDAVLHPSVHARRRQANAGRLD
ncbi:DUF2235 domain-containing protein [Spiribacter pallidus]|uniref:DUF2235 domain-containing protein n=1 Tax=Spiribacter pallidus TaxID=1987936 RepID=A0ABV3TE80_9GAMM